jgi:hypothetical protein
MTKRPLVPCTACERHVRAGESRCPFCGALGSVQAAPLLKTPKGRLSSLLVMTFQAATATAAIGCGGETADPVPPNTGGTAGRAGSGGSGVIGTGGEQAGTGDVTGSGANTGTGGFDTGTGGKATGSGGSDNQGTGGVIDFGTGGDPWQGGRGGAVPIYRATPRG